MTSRCTATVWCSRTRAPPTCGALCSTPRAAQRAGTARTPTSSCARAVPARGSSEYWPPGSRRCRSVQAAFQSGTARFLDVGVGVGAISIGLCRALSGHHLRRSRRGPRGARSWGGRRSRRRVEDRVELRELLRSPTWPTTRRTTWLGCLSPSSRGPAFEAGVVLAVPGRHGPTGGSSLPLMTPPDDSTGVRAGRRGPRRPSARGRTDRGLRGRRDARATPDASTSAAEPSVSRSS